MTSSDASTESICSLCWKKLGIVSAGAAGLNELVRVLQATILACPFWDLAITFGRNGNTVLNGLLLAARAQLLRWLSEWDDTLLLAGSPAAMQVRRKGKRDPVRYLGEPPPTVLLPLWGWRCWLLDPAVSKQCLTPTMVNLRMTGLCPVAKRYFEPPPPPPRWLKFAAPIWSRLASPVAELQKVARDEKVSFGMATLHFVGKFESQVYYQTLWYWGIRTIIYTYKSKMCVRLWVWGFEISFSSSVGRESCLSTWYHSPTGPRNVIRSNFNLARQDPIWALIC